MNITDIPNLKDTDTINGVYRVVSKKYLQAYIDKYSWRYNNRMFKDRMFERLLGEIVNVKAFPVRII